MKFGSTNVTYDHGNNAASGNPLVQTQGNGNIADDGTRTYQFDALNRLSIVKKKSGGNTIATYTYDALGRRILKVVTNGGVTGTVANGTYRYISDSQQIVEELNGSNSTTRQFVWGQYIDELTQMKTYVSTGSQPLAAGVYYLLNDLLYRSIALTNSSGAIVETYDTDAYGNTIVYSAAGTASNWFADDATTSVQPACETIFQGRQYDPETQIYFYRARYYHPQLGRFVSRDPLFTTNHVFHVIPLDLGVSADRQSIELYNYEQNNPLNQLDPSGLASWTDCASKWLPKDKVFRSVFLICAISAGPIGSQQYWQCVEKGTIGIGKTLMGSFYCCMTGGFSIDVLDKPVGVTTTCQNKCQWHLCVDNFKALFSPVALVGSSTQLKVCLGQCNCIPNFDGRFQ